jgi:hypothetical protein
MALKLLERSMLNVSMVVALKRFSPPNGDIYKCRIRIVVYVRNSRAVRKKNSNVVEGLP